MGRDGVGEGWEGLGGERNNLFGWDVRVGMVGEGCG